MENRHIATKVAWSLVGTPYIWGGDDPILGFDCSGSCIEICKSAGTLPRKGDWNADGLYHYFEDCEVAEPYEGCLVFWKDTESGRMVHVEYCIDSEFSIGASGGRSITRTREDAIEQNAYIMVRPFRTRGGIMVFVDPFLGG